MGGDSLRSFQYGRSKAGVRKRVGYRSANASLGKLWGQAGRREQSLGGEVALLHASDPISSETYYVPGSRYHEPREYYFRLPPSIRSIPYLFRES